MDTSIWEAIARFGLSTTIAVVLTGAGIKILWFLVQHIVEKQGVEISKTAQAVDKMTAHIQEFGNHVRREHKEMDEKQSHADTQHQEILMQMKEVTTILGRINGFRKEG